ncbi:30S ribosomal protein S20 [Candidatus Peribacteria bacterium RIFCSPLOWO2_01_FULL_51_18]|nr:MAG: 30S ribosomal protein S20 [Candidatus Peribacteria bacterium RIFCSPHIGHO2_02_FULL_51_15]OGJ65164.1 MAG: 30S ribosomal protein S20 [Candidatus Peribacteria bacterium RIFCSPLOWO2_01_FULL_51_18]OGJ65165.1 MAG: 30S ribosomal protein S20 [Candidatus Peribacteria bacterium RIFCSPLOWO2_01_FULL_51_18]
MPLLKSSIKHMKQSVARRARRLPFKTSMKTQIRKVTVLVKADKLADAAKALPIAFKAIDMAAKKNIIHWKNAARKKSSLSRMVARVK